MCIFYCLCQCHRSCLELEVGDFYYSIFFHQLQVIYTHASIKCAVRMKKQVLHRRSKLNLGDMLQERFYITREKLMNTLCRVA